MLASKNPEPAPFLNEFLTTMAQGGSLNYCSICLRTENERRLVDHKALITFTKCVSLNRQWKNKLICYMCHRQASKAVTFLRGVSFAGNMDALFADLLDQTKSKKDVFQNSVFQALLIKHGMEGLKYSPEGWETELRCIRRATTLKCRRTKVTGVGTGRPQHDRLSSRNLYLVHEESDDLPSNPESELASASTFSTTTINHNQSTSANETINLTSSNRSSVAPTSLSTSLNPGLPKQINQSFACCEGARWTRKRCAISADELAAASTPREGVYESYHGRCTDQEISRTVRRLSTGLARSNRGTRRKSTLDEAGQSRSSVQSCSRAVLTTVDEAGPSRVDQAGPSRVEQAGPSRVEQAGPSRIEQAGPSREERAGPSRVEQPGHRRVEKPGHRRVEKAGHTRVEQVGPSRVEQTGPSHVEQAGPSRVEQAGHRRVEQVGPSRKERVGPSRVEQAGPSREERAGHRRGEQAGHRRVEQAGHRREEQAGYKREEQAGPSRVERAGPSRVEQAGSSCVEHARPSRIEKAGPSHVEQAGPSRVEQAGYKRVEKAGHRRVEQAGPSRVEQAGPSHVKQAGPSHVEQAGPSHVEHAGHRRVEQAGPSRLEQVGPSRVEQAGPSRVEQARPSQASEAGPSRASKAGPSWTSEAGPSWAYEAGTRWFYEAQPSWAYDVGPNWASQVGPSRVYKARHTSTDKAETSRSNQAGMRAEPISSKECRKGIGKKSSQPRHAVSINRPSTTDRPVNNTVIPPQAQSEKVLILKDGEEDDGIELQIEKMVATDVTPDSLLSNTSSLKRQLNEPVNRALEHDNAPSTSQKQIQVNTVYYVPENQLGQDDYSALTITDDSPLTQNNINSNCPLILPPLSQSESGQSGPNRKRSLDGASMMATPNKRAVLPGRADRRVDSEDKIPAGVISYKSTADPSSNLLMPPPPKRYVMKTPASVRVQEHPRTHTGGGDVLTSVQHASTINLSTQMAPLATQTSYLVTTCTPPPLKRMQGPPRTHTGGSEVFISAQAAVKINPDPDGPSTGRPAPGPLRRPRYVGRNQGQPTVQDAIRKYTISNEDSD